MTDHDEQCQNCSPDRRKETDFRKLDKLTAEINALLENESAERKLDERNSA